MGELHSFEVSLRVPEEQLVSASAAIEMGERQML